MEKPHPHVELVNGQAQIKGTRVPVRRIWAWHRKGVLVETLVKRYPTLGWAKVLDALSWSYDNMEQIEKELEEERASLLDGAGSESMAQLPLNFQRRQA